MHDRDRQFGDPVLLLFLCCTTYSSVHIGQCYVPMFGAVFAALILKDRTPMIKGWVLCWEHWVLRSYLAAKPLIQVLKVTYQLRACFFATICYGLSSIMIKKYAGGIETKALAGASQLFAGLSLLPFLLVTGVSDSITLEISLTVIVFAVLCSAIAYLIYYYLLKEIGPIKSLTVTFHMPVFGMLWGCLILGESLSHDAHWGRHHPCWDLFGATATRLIIAQDVKSNPRTG